MGRMTEPNCTRCGQEGADFLHIMWYCGNIERYWQQVIRKIGKVLNEPIIATLELCLLGIQREKRGSSRYNRMFLQEVLFLARKQIVEKWIQPNQPTVIQWVRAVNQVLPYKRIMYEQRGNLQRFENIWAKWNRSCFTLDVGIPENKV